MPTNTIEIGADIIIAAVLFITVFAVILFMSERNQ